jgi:hypothetical protein
MSRPKIRTPEPPSPPTVDLPFLVSASKLRDRKIKRRRIQGDGPGPSEAIRPVEIGLKVRK